jgi:penicillin-binding protein 2
VSSDVYFYNAGNDFWNIWKLDPKRGLGIQQVARQLGFGQPTGIELGEAAGRIPDPAWKTAFANQNYKTATEKQANAIWYPADNIFAAVGQGDDFVTPLQLANAYACFANGGTLWTQYVAQVVTNPTTNRTVEQYTPKLRGKITIDANTYSQMAAGFLGAVADKAGTAYQAFQGLPIRVAGKTGTAQIAGKGPTALFASYFPANAPTYAVVAVVEQGGHGAQTAAPIVRQVIEAINHLPPTAIPTGNGATGKD